MRKSLFASIALAVKDGDGKPRVLASSATYPATKDPKMAELPTGSLATDWY